MDTSSVLTPTSLKRMPIARNLFLKEFNAIYYQLTSGLLQDTKMSKPNRFAASFSDMTRRSCIVLSIHVLRRRELVMKAAAAYDT